MLEMADVILYKCVVFGTSSAFREVYSVATVVCPRASHVWKQGAVGTSSQLIVSDQQHIVGTALSLELPLNFELNIT